MINLLKQIKNKFYPDTHIQVHVIETLKEEKIDIIWINTEDFIEINYNYPKIEINSNKKTLNHILIVIWTFLTENVDLSNIKLLINDELDISINQIFDENLNFKLIINSNEDFITLRNLDIWFESPWHDNLYLKNLNKKKK